MMKPTEWPEVLPILQSIVNHTIPYRLYRDDKVSVAGLQWPYLADYQPIIPFTLSSHDPLRSPIQLIQSRHRGCWIRICFWNHSTKSIEIFRSAETSIWNSRYGIIIWSVRTANFEVGDFVSVAKKDPKSGSKLSVKCMGPLRVTRVDSKWVYEDQDLINDGLSPVHYSWLRHYSGSSLNVSQVLFESIGHNYTHYNTVSKQL